MIKILKKLVVIPTLMLILLFTFTTAILAAAPVEVTSSVNPSVSMKNPDGVWVLGSQGASYVILYEMSDHSKLVSIPENVVNQVKTNSYRGLYKKYPSYPYFVSQGTHMVDMTMLMIIPGGLSWLPNAPTDWAVGDMIGIMDNGDGTYMVHNMGDMTSMMDKGMINITDPIPLSSAVFW